MASRHGGQQATTSADRAAAVVMKLGDFAKSVSLAKFLAGVSGFSILNIGVTTSTDSCGGCRDEADAQRAATAAKMEIARPLS
jgi:hypothetical protein